MDGPMRFMQSVGLEPIVDPLHHTSFPTWLTDGFLNRDFPALYRRFIDRVSDRYDWVTKFTVINEPLATTLFCSFTGMWYPYRASDRDFVAMSLQVARCICECSRELKRKNKQVEIVYVDTAEHHRATDRRSVAWVKHANARRFLILDLVLGRVDRHHPLFSLSQAPRSDGRRTCLASRSSGMHRRSRLGLLYPLGDGVVLVPLKMGGPTYTQ